MNEKATVGYPRPFRSPFVAAGRLLPFVSHTALDRPAATASRMHLATEFVKPLDRVGLLFHLGVDFVPVIRHGPVPFATIGTDRLGVYLRLFCFLFSFANEKGRSI